MDNVVVILVIILALAAICVGGYFYFMTKARQKREVETKDQRLRDAINNVLMSDPITRDNIDILRETDSEYLPQAVDLRREQVAREERRRDEERLERRRQDERLRSE
jgi:flagellar basal body-associated protein FliL